MKVCHKCGAEWLEDFKPGFNETCERCGYDMHVCLNCRFYDITMYNHCGEPMAERVSTRDENNYCPFFDFKVITEEEFAAKSKDQSSSKDAFNNLFSD